MFYYTNFILKSNCKSVVYTNILSQKQSHYIILKHIHHLSRPPLTKLNNIISFVKRTKNILAQPLFKHSISTPEIFMLMIPFIISELICEVYDF